MGLFGFSSKKEVAEKERLAREAARKEAMGDLRERDERTRERVLQGQQNDLAKGSQIRFRIPYFDVYDPRFADFGVPVAVRGTVSFRISDNLAHSFKHGFRYIVVAVYKRNILS